MISLPVLLPPDFVPLVNNGDTIMFGQPLAQKVIKDEHVVNICEQLSIPLTKVKHVLKKNPGDEVQIGDIIAIKKGFLGLDKHTLKSRVTGNVTRYERDTGNLVIRTSSSSVTQNLVSPVDGIISLCDNKKIVIKTDKNVALGTKGSGGKIEGEVFVLEASLQTEEIDSLYHLDGRAIEKIIVGGRLSRDVLVKGVAMGAVGFIGTTIADEDIEHILSKNLSIPIIEAERETVERLSAWHGKKVFIDGKSKAIIFLHG